MKKDIFGQSIYQPDDDPKALTKQLGTGTYEVIIAFEPLVRTWTAQVRATGGKAANLEGFPTQESILLWLNKLDWHDLTIHGEGLNRSEVVEEA